VYGCDPKCTKKETANWKDIDMIKVGTKCKCKNEIVKFDFPTSYLATIDVPLISAISKDFNMDKFNQMDDNDFNELVDLGLVNLADADPAAKVADATEKGNGLALGLGLGGLALVVIIVGVVIMKKKKKGESNEEAFVDANKEKADD